MKIKILLAVAALLAVSGSSAFAQGLPTPVVTSLSASASSWVAGGEAGYNWQQGAWVYGLATDIYGTHLGSQASTVVTFGVPAFVNLNSDIDWYGTVRGRLGWSSGPLLFYGTGGLAYGGLNLSGSLSAPGVPMSLNAQTSSVRAGWVAGGGIEYMWRPNVLLSLEYQYVDLGTLNLAGAATGSGGGGAFSTVAASEHGRFSALTVGVSWLFTPAGAPRRGAWEGGYLAGRVGGAWGNDTNATYSFFPGFPSDMRLKRDIALLGRLDDGLGLYRYRYLWSDTVYVGVMAQEVALLHPDAIVRSALDDYLRVDYGRLGLKLLTLAEWERARQK
jgi:outer membrane immunogenic protein